MTSAAPGTDISPVEVTNISRHGFWLLLGDEELFLPFSEFPWFRDVPVGKILNVELPSSNHLYWPGLDVDLAVESIRDPKAFPLVSRVGALVGGLLSGGADIEIFGIKRAGVSKADLDPE